ARPGRRRARPPAATTRRGRRAAPGPGPRPTRRRAPAPPRPTERPWEDCRGWTNVASCSAARDDGRMKVSTRGDYAARALLSLALHGSDRPTSVKEIAERTHLPQPYLEQILLSVKGAGLVRSKRGVGGGYVLARSAAEITLAEIVAAVEGPQLPLQ